MAMESIPHGSHRRTMPALHDIRHHCTTIMQTHLQYAEHIAKTRTQSVLFSAIFLLLCAYLLRIAIKRHAARNLLQYSTPPGTPGLEKRSGFRSLERENGGKDLFS